MVKERLCAKALEIHQDRLMAAANVVGLGIVSSPGAKDSDDVELAVYVQKKLPLESLDDADRIPSVVELPEGDDVHEIAVRVIEQGPVSLEDPTQLE